MASAYYFYGNNFTYTFYCSIKLLILYYFHQPVALLFEFPRQFQQS